MTRAPRRRPVVRALRACGSAFLFASYGVGSLLFGFVLFPLLSLALPRRSADRAMRALVRASYRLFVRCARWLRLFRVEADADALASLRGCVVAANHLTLIDVVILMSLTGDSVAVAKGAVAENPFFRQVVRRAFLVNRGDAAPLVADAARALAAGLNVVVFPEGTRTPDAAAHRLHRGAARMALAAGAPLAPVRIACDPPVLAKGQPWWDVADREVVFTVRALDPIPVAGPDTRPAAVALTARLAVALFGGRAA